MSTLNIVRGITLQQDRGAGMVPLLSDRFVGSENPTTGAASVASTSAAGAGEIWNLTAVGSDMWITFGTTPVAVVGSGMRIKDGVPIQLSATAGYKVAAINAS